MFFECPAQESRSKFYCQAKRWKSFGRTYKYSHKTVTGHWA
jgi:hypothetical protein